MVLDIYERCNADDGCRERWQRWELHRHIMNCILSERIFSAVKIKDAVVLGAGRCEDIDLKFLLDHVQSLTLVDYDYNSMEKALERQELSVEEKEKIILKGNIEFTGFYNKDFIDNVIAKIKMKENPATVMQFVMERLNSAASNVKELLDNQEYSLVISGAVHSQLIVPYTEIAAIDNEYRDVMMSEAGNIANILAENYNKVVASLVKKDGWLFSYFDVMELSERNNTLSYEGFINGLMAQNEYEKIDEFFVQTGGVAGARHGYKHLCELAEKYMTYNKSWIWNFRDNKKYYVHSICFRKV
ncbi:hypothetical protein [Aminipila sp.]|uniref:hypothetical protein n=1 Tax=Aminipila sp. TaxID=2060095 RepID=UPI00289EC290|nr:hypothetical protein [Aminipila sp.]